jgi:hypothetical protein
MCTPQPGAREFQFVLKNMSLLGFSRLWRHLDYEDFTRCFHHVDAVLPRRTTASRQSMRISAAADVHLPSAAVPLLPVLTRRRRLLNMGPRRPENAALDRRCSLEGRVFDFP